MKLLAFALCLPLVHALQEGEDDVRVISDCMTSNTGVRTCKFPEIDLAQRGLFLQFEASDLIVRCERTKQRDPNSWHGECHGSDNDANFIRTLGTDGKASIYGSIHIGDEVCHIAPNSAGDPEIACRPYSVFEDEWEADHIDNDDDGRHLVATDAVFAMSKSINLRRRLQTDYDDGKTLDLMVVWTKSAECGYSSMTYPCELTSATETRMRNLVTLAVIITDQAFALSGIDAKIRVVHAYRHETYEEPATNAWNTMAMHLRNGNDGHLDDVHQKRALYGSDLVHMISASTGSCGVGYVGPTKSRMFSISRYTCAIDNFSFGHELAHNLGAHHDRGSLNRCEETSLHNFGFKEPNAEFRSIMSYDCQTTQCDSLPKQGCPRVQRYSNKMHQYNAKSIGDDDNNNADVIVAGLKVAARYFTAMNCQSDSECDDNDPSTINSCNLSNNVCVFTNEVKITETPTTSPTTDLSQYANLGALETIVVSSVSTESWKIVPVSSSFNDPVAACTVKYDDATSLLPTVVRLKNVSRASFEVKLQNPSRITSSIAPRVVHCVVVETGVWELPDGSPIEARKFQSSITDSKDSWIGERQTLQHDYSTPVVFGQVMTHNDPAWSAFWSRGKDQYTCADSDYFFAGKHIGEDADLIRNDETIGYIVMDASRGQLGSTEFDVGQSFPFVAGYTQGNYQLSFSSAFSSAPRVTVLSQCAMAGVDGSWPVITTDATATGFGVAVDEDQRLDPERNHAPEALNFMAFSSQGSITLVPIGNPTTLSPTPTPTIDFGYMESMVVPNVDSATWVTVNLSKSFDTPVPVCTVRYDSGTSLLPAAVRMQNIEDSSFQIRLQNPSDEFISERDVHCFAVEKGVWSLPDGRTVEAFQYTSTRTDNRQNWIGEAQTFSHEYSVPVILGQVTTFNDSRFVTFWSRGATRFAHAEVGGEFFTGKHLGSGLDWQREDESIGVIVIEAGHQKGSVDFEAGRGPTEVLGYVDGQFVYDFMESFSSAPAVTILSVPMMVGVDGCWPVLTSDPTPASFGVAVDEDQSADAERAHAGEFLDYLAFSAEGIVALTPDTQA